MKRFFPLQLVIALVCAQTICSFAQDSVKKKNSYINPAAKHAEVNYKSPVPFDHKNPPINKLVENVRYAYYRDKTDAQVAAILYADRASYYRILDRVYNDYDAKKGISRSAFLYDIIKKYGDPFPSAKPLPVQTAAQPPDTEKKSQPVKTAAAPIDKSLNGQYQYLLTKIYHYQQPLVEAFHKNVMDSLALKQRALQSDLDKIAAQGKMIDSLQKAVNTAEEESAGASESTSLLGIPINTLLWGLVILSLAVTVIVIVRSGANRREAKYRTQLYDELTEEFKAYKVKANEKEKKLARELQNERNKLDDMLGK